MILSTKENLLKGRRSRVRKIRFAKFIRRGRKKPGLRRSIAKKILLRVAVLFLVAMTVLFVGTYHFVKRFIVEDSRSYADSILKVTSSELTAELDFWNLSLQDETAESIFNLLGDEICQNFNVDYLYVYSLDPDQGLIRYYGIVCKREYEDRLNIIVPRQNKRKTVQTKIVRRREAGKGTGMGYTEEVRVIRDLAKRYMEVATSDRYVRMRKRFRDTNDLKIVRPPVIIEEIPWEQMNIDGALTCVCEDRELRRIEYGLRVGLFRDRYFKCDNYTEPFWTLHKSFTKIQNDPPIREKVLHAKNTSISSHEYEDVFTDESVIEQFRDPVITAHPEEDAKNLAHLREIFGDAMPVVLRGHGIYHAPWDVIVRLHGVENTLTDMYDRPEFLHKIIRRFTERMASEMDQMEAQHLYDPRLPSLHCTPGDITPENDTPEDSYGCRDIWFRTMAQMFSSVSPAAHDEFDVQYSLPLAARCAHTYYGCCEPLHDRLDIIKQYPNLRKIGVSPWANVEQSAEQIGGNYVLARKPNPANVAIATDPEVIKKELIETVELCRKYGCPFDYVLKDISTVSDRPQNLILWAKTVSDVLDGYYGEA